MTSPDQAAEISTADALELERQRIDAEVARLLRKRRQLDAATTGDVTANLYDWQRDALDAWVAAGRQGVVEAVTGTGKTRVGVAAIEQAYLEGRRSVVLVPTKVLKQQWLENVQLLLPHLTVSTDPRESAAAPWDVAIMTPLIAARYEVLDTGERALLVADEAHRYGSESYREALDESDFDQRLGLTATLSRGDDGDEALEKFFGGTCFSLDYDRAVADHLIAPFKIAFARVPFTAEEADAYSEITKQMSDALSKLSPYVPLEPIGEFMSSLQRLANDRQHPKSGLARWYLKLFNTRRKLFANSAQKHVALRALLPVVRDSNGTLVFTQTKDAAAKVSEMFNEAQVQSAAIDADVSNRERDALVAQFGQGELQALAAPVVFDEGVDLPNADLGVVITATHRRRQMMQRFGRVLRKGDPNKIARFVVFVLSGSSEDPLAHGHEPTFADELAHLAVEAENFDLSLEDELDRLVSFLAPGTKAGPNPFTAKVIETTPKPAPAATHPPAATETSSEPVPEGVTVRPIDRPDPFAADLLPISKDIKYSEDALQDYQDRISNVPLLDAEDEVRLAQEIELGLAAANRLAEGRYESRVERRLLQKIKQEGERAFDLFLRANLRLVVSRARKHYGKHAKHRPDYVESLEFMDYVQFGNEGLDHAVRMFDYKQGNKFSTYATWWIDQRIDRGVMDTAHRIRVPVHLQSQRLSAGHGYKFEDSELGQAAQRAVDSRQSLQEISDSELPGVPDPADEVDARLDEDHLFRLMALAIADDRDWHILVRRFGLDGDEPATLDEIGEELGVTRERVRQLEKAALARLRNHPKICAAAGRSLPKPSEGEPTPETQHSQRSTPSKKPSKPAKKPSTPAKNRRRTSTARTATTARRPARERPALAVKRSPTVEPTTTAKRRDASRAMPNRRPSSSPSPRGAQASSVITPEPAKTQSPAQEATPAPAKKATKPTKASNISNALAAAQAATASKSTKPAKAAAPVKQQPPAKAGKRPVSRISKVLGQAAAIHARGDDTRREELGGGPTAP